MSNLTLSGVLEGLTALETSDLTRFKAAVGAGHQMGWSYYFPYLLSKDKPGRRAVLLGEDEGALCEYQWGVDDVGPRLDLLFPPCP